jgi:hypothetical protein
MRHNPPENSTTAFFNRLMPIDCLLSVRLFYAAARPSRALLQMRGFRLIEKKSFRFPLFSPLGI